MKVKDGTADFGQWTVPTSWDELTLGQFQELQRYYNEDNPDQFDARDVVHILCQKEKEEVDELPADFFGKILEKTSFLSTVPEISSPSPSVTINGEKYTVNIVSKLKVKEFVAAEQVQKNDKFDFASLLGILCRKNGEKYDDEFENEVLPERVEMFRKQPFVKVMPIANFFLILHLISQDNGQLYTATEALIEDTQQRLKRSKRDTLYLAHYMKLRKLSRKLKKLAKGT